MNPFFFGAAPRRLFGIYQPARSASAENRAIAFCNPLGSEYLHSHRTIRLLAKMLAAEGFHSLRFDYFGTGDSAGETTEADLEGWRADIAVAIDELTHAAACDRVSLIGLRLGATLAADAAARQPERIDSLVLWDPVISGAEYLEELWVATTKMPRVSRPPPSRSAESGGGHEFLGFPITAAMEDEIRKISLASIKSVLAARTLIVMSQATPSTVELQAHAENEGSGVIALEAISDLHPWIERNDAGAVPAKTLKRIVQWMA